MILFVLTTFYYIDEGSSYNTNVMVSFYLFIVTSECVPSACAPGAIECGRGCARGACAVRAWCDGVRARVCAWCVRGCVSGACAWCIVL